MNPRYVRSRICTEMMRAMARNRFADAAKQYRIGVARKMGVLINSSDAMPRTFVALLCFCFALPASAKLGETVPQLAKRFGKSYTVEPDPLGKKYKFRSANVSVDAIVANGISICETYLSDHPLTASGEPPNDIVRGVLKTNLPKARWLEIEPAPFGADYALRSSDDKYIAILKYSGTQPENSVWVMTVGLADSVRALSNVSPPPPAPTALAVQNPSPTPFVTASSSAPAKYISTDLTSLIALAISLVVWLPFGFVIGLFVTAQIALPLILGLPRAIRLVSRGEMRSAVFARLLITPILWVVILFLIGFFWPAGAAWVAGNAALNVGIWLGTIRILLSPLSKKSRSDFRDDFDRSYGQFYTGVASSTSLPHVDARTSMTIHEAEHILDIVSELLQDGSRWKSKIEKRARQRPFPYHQRPLSALQGYELLDIVTALKLRIANEYLLLSGRPDFEEQFSEGLKLYNSVPWSIMGAVVADDQLGQIGAELVMSAVDPATMQFDKRFDSVETPAAFGAFCKTLDARDPNYWQRVYEHIGIEYTPYCPRGNEPVNPVEVS